MKDTKLPTILLIFACIIFLSGCTTIQTDSSNYDLSYSENKPKISDNSFKSKSPSTPSFIGNLIATADEKSIEVSFSVYDLSKNHITIDGIGKVWILNSEGQKVYQGFISPKKEDFNTYTRRITGEEFKAYSWEIPLSKISNSTSSSGTLHLEFTADKTKFEELKTNMWGLPIYSDKELENINNNKYAKTAIEVNEKISKGSFEVEIEKVGLFEPVSIYDKPEAYFRVDIKVTNIGDEKEYFSPSAIAILDNQGNQFEREYGGTLNIFSEIYPGVKKSGYILFEKMPTNTQEIKLVFELGYDRNWDAYMYEYDISLIV